MQKDVLVCYGCGTEAEFAFSQNSGHCICCGGGVIATYEEYEKKLKGERK